MIDSVGAVIEKHIGNLVEALFSYRCQKRIKNHNFTILCSNCIGGIIYHRLNMEFFSPTINLWIRQYDFIKFLKKPKWYLNQKLQFIETKYSFPVATLGDIKIHFNHSKDSEVAEKDWNRRKERIYWDNLYIILYDRDNLSREQILSLKDIKCKRLIVLSERDTYCDISYVHKINRSHKGRANEQVFLDKDWFGITTFEKQFDFVAWLNDKRM